jgi:L-threonylcarbamoyladenylate synthase
MILLDRATAPEAARHAVAEAMGAGGVALIPTDTVYGIACLPSFDSAVDSIYELKLRPRDRRVPIIVAGAEDAARLGLAWTDPADRLARSFWPGALTIAVGVEEPAVDWLAGRVEVGVRAPADELSQALAAAHGPFLMTSANRHGQGTPTTLEEALASLHGTPAIAVDGGSLDVVSSTVVNVNLPAPAIEREGAIPASAVMEALAGDE